MPTSDSGGSPPLDPREAEKKRKLLEAAFAAWRGRLLDLTARNRALNYRPTKVSTLTIVDEKPGEVYRLLVGEEQALSFAAVLQSGSGATESGTAANQTDTVVDAAAVQAFTPYEREDVAERHRDTVLQCHATPESLDLSLRRIAEQQRTSLEEQGVNTVFLALGFLRYRESSTADEASRAPLCGYRSMPITDSGASRSLIPVEADHRFRSKPIAERIAR